MALVMMVSHPWQGTSHPESLANEALMEEIDSVKAEDGFVKSLNMAPSM